MAEPAAPAPSERPAPRRGPRLSLSLAGRLALVTAAVLAVALGFVSTVRTVALRDRLLSSTALELETDYETLLSGEFQHGPGLELLYTQPTKLLDFLVSPSVGALVATPAGQVAYSLPSKAQPGLAPPVLPAKSYMTAFGPTPPLYTVAGSIGHRQLVVLEALTSQNGQEAVAVFELATPLRPIDATLRQQLEFDVLAGLLALLAASLAIYGLLGRFLLPLQQMAVASAKIASDDRDVELPEATGDDEVSRLAQAFNRMAKRVDEAIERERAEQRRVRSFVADASHTLRTPLTVLNGRLDLLLRGHSREGPELEEALRDLRVEGERMARIVRGLLLLARIDEGGERPPQPVDVGAVLGELRPRLEAVVGDRTLVLAAAPDLIATATVEALETIVTNLVENASHHAPADGTIEVRVDQAQGQVRLRVLDDGPGIPAGDIPRLFDRFFRGSEGRARRAGGAGLGLSIVARWAEVLGGRAEAGNRETGGAVFTVWLPPAAPLRPTAPG